MDLTQFNKRSRNAFEKAVRQDENRRLIQRQKSRTKRTWEREYDEEAFRILRDAEHLCWDNPDELGADRFYWLKDGDWLFNDSDEPVALGALNKPDGVSGSLLFYKKLDNQRPRYFSLARFAWWYHHGEDCGGSQFPRTRGCHLIDTSDPRNVHPDNLLLGKQYNELRKEVIKEEYHIKQEEEVQAKLAIQQEWVARIIRLNNLTTAVKHCAEVRYDDPVRDLLEAHPSINLRDLFIVDPEAGTVAYRNGPKRRKSLLKFTTVEGFELPAANLMWYLCTGTFAGKLRSRNGYPNNIRLRNLVPDQLDYRKRIGYA